jgi:sn-glycerol 3-phosphate transport system substrate-binding protein
LSSKYGNDGAKPQVPANLLQASAVRGEQIALPLYLTMMVAMYNADALRKAAVDASSITTWDGWRDAGAKLTAVSKEPSIWLHIGVDPYWSTQNLVRSNGGRVLGCASDKAVAAFAQPPAIEAMNFWSSMVNDGTCAIFPGPNAIQAFLSGQLKVLFTSAGAWQSLKSQASFPVEAAAMPQFGSKPRQLPIAGQAMVCFAAEDAKRSASWRLMEFLASGKAQAAFDDATGYLPVSTDVPAPTEPFRKLVLSELPAAVGPESFPGANGSHAQAQFGGGVMGMFSKKQQPAAVLPPLASQVDGLITGQACA